MFSIGLTGGIGCGKTTVSDLFAARGATIIDTDQIAHTLTTPDGLAIPAITAEFGADFLAPDGSMDRAKMRELVFSDAVAKKRLEAILHPLIGSQTREAAEQARGAYLIYVVPLLVESGKWKERVHRILVIDCPEAMQVARVILRSGLSAAQVEAIMATQVSRSARVAAADDIITNDADTAALVPQVDRLHAMYCTMAAGAA